MKKNITKRIFSIVLATVLLLSLMGCSNTKKLDTASRAYSAMIVCGINSESLAGFIHETWHSAIFDDDSVYDDFNDALAAIFSTSAYKDWVSQIEGSYEIADKYMDELDDLGEPSKDDEDLYENLEELHDICYDFMQLAVNPSGSLETYTESINDLSPKLAKYIDYVGGDFPEDYDREEVEFTDEENDVLHPED